MRAVRCFVLLVIATAPALAEGWEVTTARDPMTDRTYNTATISSPGGASLRIACVNGSVSPDLVFAQRVSRVGTVGVTYRFDDGPVVPRIAPVSSSGRDVWLWLGQGDALALVRRAKRLRVEAVGKYYDFDLTGGAEAIAKVRC